MAIKSKKQKSSSKKVETGSPLTANQAKASLRNLTGWHLSSNSKMIYREFLIKDFVTAIDFIDRIADIAENAKHHPDIHLTEYRKLRIELTTHDVGGLSEDDFIEAGKINRLPVKLKSE